MDILNSISIVIGIVGISIIIWGTMLTFTRVVRLELKIIKGKKVFKEKQQGKGYRATRGNVPKGGTSYRKGGRKISNLFTKRGNGRNFS